MSEETTTSSSRIFVKILFQELCAYMGLPKLNQRLKDPYEKTGTHFRGTWFLISEINTSKKAAVLHI